MFFKDPRLIHSNLFIVRSCHSFPGSGWYAELDFLHGTGASVMSVFEGDAQNIMGISTVEPTVVGLNSSTLADGRRMISPVVELEVTKLENERRWMKRWARV